MALDIRDLGVCLSIRKGVLIAQKADVDYFVGLSSALIGVRQCHRC